jgi:hypothetical protein
VTVGEHCEVFGGKPVRDFDPAGEGIEPAEYAYRVGLGYEAFDSEETMAARLEAYLGSPGSAATTALLIGTWTNMVEDSSEETVRFLAGAAARLPHLQALFLGDVTFEECEISWIVQSDISPLFAAYPRLQHLVVRGAQNLSLGKVSHKELRSLRIESGGIPVGLLNEVIAADLPNLEELVLWLGVENYGATWTLDDLRRLLDGTRFPELRALGLCDSDQQDEVAQVVVASPVMKRLRSLDLSLGTLTDAGAEHLAGSGALGGLERLDLRHHYMTDAGVRRLRAAAPGVALDVSEAQDAAAAEDRYAAVTE